VRFLPIKLDMVCIVAKVLICMVWKINISEKLEEWVQITNFLLAVSIYSATVLQLESLGGLLFWFGQAMAD